MKKVVALVLALILILACLPLSVSAASYKGDGTVDSPYLITTKKELNAVRKDPGACYKLANDIVFTEDDFKEDGDFYNYGFKFIPIGDSDTPFEGTFDGNGHVIQGLQIYADSFYEKSVGLFGYVWGAEIFDLTIKEPNIIAKSDIDTSNSSSSSSVLNTGSDCGAVAGYICNSTIRNCKVISGTISNFTGNFSSQNYGNVGGIVGKANYYSYIFNCSNSARIYRFNAFDKKSPGGVAGGIVGYCSGMDFCSLPFFYGSTSVHNCSNSGQIIHRHSHETGGIIGYVEEGDVSIQNCKNSGSFDAKYAGGIVGSVSSSFDDQSVEIDNCKNTGKIKADTAGGIVRAIQGYNVSITDCTFAGSITRNSGTGYIGGIAAIGDSSNIDELNLLIKNCNTTGGRFISKSAKNVSPIIANRREVKVSKSYYTPATVNAFSTSPLSYNSVSLKWNQVLCATGYKIYRATSKDGEYKQIATIGKSTTTKYTDKGLKLGTTYYYKIAAYYKTSSQYNTGKTKAIAQVKVSTAAPTPTVKQISSGKINISWKKVTKATGYQVFRSTSKNGTYKNVMTIKNGSTVSFTNSGLSRNKTYYYKVRSFTKVNGKTIYSPFSAIKYAKA